MHLHYVNTYHQRMRRVTTRLQLTHPFMCLLSHKPLYDRATLGTFFIFDPVPTVRETLPCTRELAGALNFALRY